MRLTQKNIIPYLLDKGFVNTESVINGDIMSRQVMSRNSIFHITLDSGTGRFVKQLQNMTPQDIYWMQKDATAHYLLHRNKLYSKTKTYIPKYFGYDLQSHVLVLDYFLQSDNLYDRSLKEGKLSTEYIKQIADIFISYQKDIGDSIADDPSLQFYNRELPGILVTPELTIDQSMGLVLNMVQKDDILCQGLDELRCNWSGNSLIHGDIKLANFLIVDNNDATQVKLVDWETSNIGDPLWDVAGLIQSYISTWVLGQSSENNNAYDVIKKVFDIAQVKLVLSEFWHYYIQKQTLEDSKKQSIEKKVMQLTAARLLQSANEMNHVDSKQFLPSAILLIQLAQNIFKNPESAAIDFLGVTP